MTERSLDNLSKKKESTATLFQLISVYLIFRIVTITFIFIQQQTSAAVMKIKPPADVTDFESSKLDSKSGHNYTEA